MKLFLFLLVWFFGLFFNPLYADGLKNALMNIKNPSSSKKMISINGLRVNKKSNSPQAPRSRSPKTVLATVNGHKIRKRDADKLLKKLTKGKISDYDRLPQKQRNLLLGDLKKMYKIKYFKGRPGSTVIGHYDDGKSVYKKEADKYIKKVTKGKIKDIDRLPRKQRLLVLKDLQRKYKIEHFKSRPADAIIATINETNVKKAEADAYITKVTNGKVKDFDRLEDKQKYMLIKDLARVIVLNDTADKNTTQEEKENIFKQMWFEKQRSKIKISNEEVLELYESKKAKTLAENPQAKIPPYMTIGLSLKNELLEKKIIANLMKDVNITINYENDENSIQDLNNSNDLNNSFARIQ